MTYMIRVMFSSWLIVRKAGEILYRRQSSVGQVKSIKILVVEGEKDFTLSTQLDDESTIRILEVCLNKLKYVVQELNKLEENYNKTINDLMNCNSLVVKMEQLFNLIGAIGTISIEDEDKLDKTLANLENYVKSIRNWN